MLKHHTIVCSTPKLLWLRLSFDWVVIHIVIRRWTITGPNSTCYASRILTKSDIMINKTILAYKKLIECYKMLGDTDKVEKWCKQILALAFISNDLEAEHDAYDLMFYNFSPSKNRMVGSSSSYCPNKKMLSIEQQKRQNNKTKLSNGIFGQNYENELAPLISKLKGYVPREEEVKISTEKVLLEHYKKWLNAAEGLIVHHDSIGDIRETELLLAPQETKVVTPISHTRSFKTLHVPRSRKSHIMSEVEKWIKSKFYTKITQTKKTRKWRNFNSLSDKIIEESHSARTFHKVLQPEPIKPKSKIVKHNDHSTEAEKKFRLGLIISKPSDSGLKSKKAIMWVLKNLQYKK